MSWAKIDDRANEHKKQLKAGPEACWLWACGLMYANRQDARDGFIPEEALYMLYRFVNPESLAEKLVEVRLWDKVDGGWQIHNFTKWNLSKEQKEAELAAGRERAAKSYSKKKSSSTEDTSDSSPEEDAKKNMSSGSGVVEDLLSDPKITKAQQQALDIRTVFEAWKLETGKTKAKQSPNRESRIRSRLNEGFTADELVLAIKNRVNNEFLMGKNDTGTTYDEIETLLRDATQVEKLMALTAIPGSNRGDIRQQVKYAGTKRDAKGRPIV